VFTFTPHPQESCRALLARISRLALRHPQAALRRLQAFESGRRAAGDLVAAIDALYLRFYLLEQRGRALELQSELEAARHAAAAGHFTLQAARAAEALGRIAYQQGDYLQAAASWSDALELAELCGDVRVEVSVRIGLGQIQYARGAWERGRRVLREAAQRLGDVDDSYLAAKLALNLGVSHFECGELADAERQFSHGLAAARRGQHREFEAEAHWQLARAALAGGRTDWATADCRLALKLASHLEHGWLEAAASRTWTEIALARGDTSGAIRSTRHALALAERIRSRSQQSQAHLQLAQLLQQSGQAEAALQHLWQHQSLESELERLGGSAGPQALGLEPDPSAPEMLLLRLSNRRWPLQSEAELVPALRALCLAAQQVLQLDLVQLWWDAEHSGELQLLDGTARLAPPEAERYLSMMRARDTALVLADLELHPCHREFAALKLPGQAVSRQELPLFVQQRLAGVLWLAQSRQNRSWSHQDLLHAAHLARLFENLLLQHELLRSRSGS
jgi:tetratricopeptide (TPR) repeat protein